MKKLIATAKTTTSPALYKEFFKLYYKERTRILIRITTVIGILAILSGIYCFFKVGNLFAIAAPIAAGIVLLIQPHFAYRRPYKSAKDNKITTKFEFYDDRLIEIRDSSKDSHKYSSLLKAVETEKYIYIYHTRESASVVDKSSIHGCTPAELAAQLKNHIKYVVKEK